MVTTQSGAAEHFKFNELIEFQQLPLETAASGELRIGMEQNAWSKVKMDLAEAVVFDRAVTASERALLVEHYSAKYGLQA